MNIIIIIIIRHWNVNGFLWSVARDGKDRHGLLMLCQYKVIVRVSAIFLTEHFVYKHLRHLKYNDFSTEVTSRTNILLTFPLYTDQSSRIRILESFRFENGGRGRVRDFISKFFEYCQKIFNPESFIVLFLTLSRLQDD